ncbi:MAG: MBL fold metallo-hydrolase [Alphaproteobacteria bacterium]
METIRPEAWYRVSHVDDDITLIDEPFIKPFYRCNIWHVRGRDRDMLVDSGMGVVSLRQHVPLVTEKPCITVASHTHFDHIGCHHEFDEKWVHPAEAGIIAAPTRENTSAVDYVSDEIFTGMPPAPYSSALYTVKDAPASRLINDGDIVDLGDRVFEVIHTPGHSVGQIMLWEAETRILFSGDMIYDGPLIEDDVPSYVASMKRIYDLPVRVVHGGHFPSFGGERYRDLIRTYLAEKDA